MYLFPLFFLKFLVFEAAIYANKDVYKTELPMAGSRHGVALLGSAGPSLQLGTETVAASDQVRVLGVTLTSVRPVSRQARCQRLCDVLLMASPTQTGPTFN